MSIEIEATSADEPTATPAAQEALEISTEAIDTNNDDFSLDGIEGLETIEAAAPTFAEIEIDGQKYQVPDAIKDGYLREADYRKKTMSLADERRDAEAVIEKRVASIQMDEKAFGAAIELKNINTQIDEYANTDWNTWYQTDPASADRAERQLERLQRQQSQLNNGLMTYQQQKVTQEQQEFATLRETCLNEAAKKIPNFNEGYRDKLEALAIKTGLSKDDVGQLVDPAGYQILHLAHIGEQVLEGRRKAGKMAAASSAPQVPQVGGNAKAGAKDPTNMSMAEYAAARSANQI